LTISTSASLTQAGAALSAAIQRAIEPLDLDSVLRMRPLARD
jgi:hypothetical protein